MAQNGSINDSFPLTVYSSRKKNLNKKALKNGSVIAELQRDGRAEFKMQFPRNECCIRVSSLLFCHSGPLHSFPVITPGTCMAIFLPVRPSERNDVMQLKMRSVSAVHNSVAKCGFFVCGCVKNVVGLVFFGVDV